MHLQCKDEEADFADALSDFKEEEECKPEQIKVLALSTHAYVCVHGMYLCIYVCMYGCMHICMYVYSLASEYTYIHAFIDTCMQA